MYGTLLRGEENHHLLGGARFVSAATTEARFELADLGSHPALVEGGTTAVRGEVYDVDAAALARIDALEQHPTWYRRVPIRVADGRIVDVYVLPAASACGRPRIAAGDWRRRPRRGGG